MANLDNIYNKVEHVHVNQRFEKDVKLGNINNIITKYQSFRNEALYIIDCKTVQVEPITNNFNDVLGIPASEISHIFHLYNHVDMTIENPFMTFVNKIVTIAWNVSIVPGKDLCRWIYRTRQGKTILKTSAVLLNDNNGCIHYTIGKLQDISSLIGFSNFRYEFLGPNSRVIFSKFNDLNEFETLLSNQELLILDLVGKGYSSPRIAEELFISRHTVNTHRRNIIRKLEVNGSINAFNKAKDMGLFHYLK